MDWQQLVRDGNGRAVMRARLPLLLLLIFGVATGTATRSDAEPKPCTGQNIICAKAKQGETPPPTSRPRPSAPTTDAPPAQPVAVDPYEYRLKLACGSRRASSVDGSDDSDCKYASTACSYKTPPSDEVMYYRWKRPKDGSTGWVFDQEVCGGDSTPGAPAPPPVPTFGQIQEAFRALPFAVPRVNIQPEGDVTLVNLPTHYEAQWPATGLKPGDISQKVQLLSWSVEFKIAPGSYNYSFGDGTESGWTDDPGGPYPEGKVRHTYKDTGEGPVKVDAKLTGWYRVNGGQWETIDTVADLQDEPVTTITVREAKARLYGPNASR